MITKKNLKIIHEWRENKYEEVGSMPPYNDREGKKDIYYGRPVNNCAGRVPQITANWKKKIKNEKTIFLIFINKFPLSYTSLLAKINTSE